MPHDAELVRRIGREAPRAPGVYLFFGDRETLLYVGKSVELRARMLSYFTAWPGTLARRIEDMVRMVRSFRCLPTRTELEALLLEDLLIKHERPPVNVSQKKDDPCSYIVVSPEAHADLRVTTRPTRPGAGHVFGPFKDRWQAARLRETLVDHLQLRACEGPVPSRACYRRDLGTCLAPCRGLADGAYGERIEQAIRFLGGDDAPLVAALEAEQAQRAATLAFEKAAAIRDLIVFCKGFARRQKFLARFRQGRLRLVEPTADPTAPLVHVFAGGRWDVRGGVRDSRGLRRRIRTLQELLGSASRGDRALTDRGLIVYRWMAKHEGLYTHEFQAGEEDIAREMEP